MADRGSRLDQVGRFSFAELQFAFSQQLSFFATELHDLANACFIDEIEPILCRYRSRCEWAFESLLPLDLAFFQTSTSHHSRTIENIDVLAKYERTGGSWTELPDIP